MTAPGRPAEQEPGRLDPATVLGAAVALLALAGLCALLGSQLLIGALRLAAGVLAGAGLGALALLAASSWLSRRPRRLVASVVALLAVTALTVPAVLDARSRPLADQAAAVLEPLGGQDRVTSVPAPADPADSPVLIRRVDGSAQLLRTDRLDALEPDAGEVLALSAEGSRLLRIGEHSTRVLTLPEGSAPALEAVVPGQVLALADDWAVARSCEKELCHLSGYELTAADRDPEETAPAAWTSADAFETRGPDPAGTQLPAVPDDPDQSAGLLDATELTGLVPEVPLRFDPDQGWLQLDPATGFPLGEILARPEQDCRIAATTPPPAGPSLQETGPTVLTVCSQDDGVMTARAHRDGALLWESAPSPAGQWQVRLDSGRVLATGTEEGAATAGEIVASGQQADWAAPGGMALQEATALTARLGMDGARMVAANADGQLVAYDTADGSNPWTHPLPEPEGMRGVLEAGTVVVLDPVERTRPLQPRRAQRLRVIDAATGQITQQTVVTEEITAVRGLSGGRALVTTEEHTLLLGAQ